MTVAVLLSVFARGITVQLSTSVAMLAGSQA